ncbi:hypothetical protein ABZX92_10190 [Lentzea sp. NPDC006480]|uniref:AMIN-like domain-containing (lipo)protein n=1 Tax=Lentzea sp. NPDC006480 TaxID=3157176 RepID=UPI0033A99AEB
MKRFIAVLAAAVMAVTIVPSASAADNALLTGVRTGQHPTFDRVVFDLTGAQPGASYSRTTEPTSCGSGKPISAPGAEFVEVRLQPAAAHDENGQPTYPGSRDLRPNLPQVKSVVFTCDFEADLSIAIGTKDANRRVDAWFTTTGPLRYVVDIYYS